ncbi:MAG TPA: helix-turn-helix transcriptional regulator [Gammaproteobacteria bacterium]|jgi:transcriptional regulator with XRE-family HTH domain|nr:helix-turn-helix transcriptional regulator [Gammaproteobacteria bacterium]
MSTDALLALEKISGKKLTLGNLIWSIRTCDEISQIDFAEKLGVSKQYLCDLEHGRKSVSPKKAKEFAKKLGYSQEQFIVLAIQDALAHDGIYLKVEFKAA